DDFHRSNNLSYLTEMVVLCPQKLPCWGTFVRSSKQFAKIIFTGIIAKLFNGGCYFMSTKATLCCFCEIV
ncbi:16268_t:CDS:1, partial [Dentiscutata erythropus]